jgi:hypothetical protein
MLDEKKPHKKTNKKKTMEERRNENTSKPYNKCQFALEIQQKRKERTHNRHRCNRFTTL